MAVWQKAFKLLLKVYEVTKQRNRKSMLEK